MLSCEYDVFQIKSNQIKKDHDWCQYLGPTSIIIIGAYITYLGAIQVLRNADGGGGGVWFSGKKRYVGVMFNVISVTRGWVGVQIPEK